MILPPSTNDYIVVVKNGKEIFTLDIVRGVHLKMVLLSTKTTPF